MAMLRLKAVPRGRARRWAAELPDHPTVMLAFAAVAEPGARLLAEHRPAIELLRLSSMISRARTHVLDAVAACPELTARDRSEVRGGLARAEEAVGLAYGPQEAMPTGARACHGILIIVPYVAMTTFVVGLWWR